MTTSKEQPEEFNAETHCMNLKGESEETCYDGYCGIQGYHRPNGEVVC